MRVSQYFISTLKDVPKDAEIASHQLMLRAGFIQQISSGIYTFLPLGLRVLQKVQDIVRRELNKSGAVEVLFPMVVPEELWRSSQRWDAYGDQLLKLTDRVGRGYCLGPTHEEVATELAKGFLQSYKQLPLNVYQIQSKFRDELRPRFGLMRGREFCMKDAYSFHANDECLSNTYEKMKEAYYQIFKACGLDVQAVEADSGDIGGSESAEFMITADTGEDAVMQCDKSGHAVNLEAAKTLPEALSTLTGSMAVEKIHTPGMNSIDDLVKGLNRSATTMIKSLLYRADDELVLVLLRGDHELNPIKLKNVLGAKAIDRALEADVRQLSGAAPGFMGPYQPKAECRIVADHSLSPNEGYTAGANEEDFHLDHVVLSRDADVEGYFDLRQAEVGDNTPWGGVYKQVRGIEVGHIFKLGDKYSKSMGATFMSEQGRPTPFLMGCYGIGVGRTVAAAIEQSHDERGMIWPKALAPFQVHLICVNPKVEALTACADQLYEQLQAASVEVLYDDRNESPGKKFGDADLIGIPTQVVVGKSLEASGEIEIKDRKTGERQNMRPEQVLAYLESLDDGC